MKKVLLLGGTGAMGVYLVDILANNQDMKVYVTSRNEKENRGNVTYIKGNARDRAFMKQFTCQQFDVIVDFMNYGYEEFKECHKELLDATGHYVFLSSSRVYDASEQPITENSPRLLDVTTDHEFLLTQRYALRKARQENMLKESGRTNYTIIRPYITYSDKRLQLGIYEKEQWLYRFLNNKPIVIREEILEKQTTLTYGRDVSYVLSRVIEHSPLSKAVHIMSTETMSWQSILDLYCSVIFEELKRKPAIYTSKSIDEIEMLFEGGYNTKYDRLFNRFFDNSFAEKEFGHVDYVPMKTGLRTCLVSFIHEWKRYGNSVFLPIDEEYEKTMDKTLAASDYLLKKE